jgi:hypothetical protein
MSICSSKNFFRLAIARHEGGREGKETNGRAREGRGEKMGKGMGEGKEGEE